MKSKIIIAVFCLFSAQAFGNNIQDAIAKKQVTAVFKVANDHSGKCVQLAIANNTNLKLKINMPAGLVLDNKDPEAQDIIITELLILELLPKAKKDILLNGCCIMQHNRCPMISDDFSLINSTNEPLIALANLIANSAQAQGYTEQNAIWSITNNNNIGSIEGDDSAKVMQYRQFVAKLLKQPMPTFVYSNYHKSGFASDTTLEIEVTGNLTLVNMKANDMIETGVYDAEGKLVSVLVKDKCIEPFGAIKKDKHKHNYAIEVANLKANKTYYLRVKVNGVVQREFSYSG
jgi:hypothetical protein